MIFLAILVFLAQALAQNAQFFPVACDFGYIVGNGFTSNFYTWPAGTDVPTASDITLPPQSHYIGSTRNITNTHFHVNGATAHNPDRIYNFALIPWCFGVELLGYYQAPMTGFYQFTMTNIDDGQSIQLGLAKGQTCRGNIHDIVANNKVVASKYWGTSTNKASYYLEAGKYYPMRTMYYNKEQNGESNILVTLPDGTDVANSQFDNVWQFGEPPVLTETTTVGYDGYFTSTSISSGVTTYTSNSITTTAEDDLLIVYSPTLTGILTTSTSTAKSLTTFTSTGFTTVTGISKNETVPITVVEVVTTSNSGILTTTTITGSSPTTFTSTGLTTIVSGNDTKVAPVTEVNIVTTAPAGFLTTKTIPGSAPTTLTSTELTTYTSGSETFTATVTEVEVVEPTSATASTVTEGSGTATFTTTGLVSYPPGSATFATTPTSDFEPTSGLISTTGVAGSVSKTSKSAQLTKHPSGSNNFSASATDVGTPTTGFIVTPISSSIFKPTSGFIVSLNSDSISEQASGSILTPASDFLLPTTAPEGNSPATFTSTGLLSYPPGSDTLTTTPESGFVFTTTIPGRLATTFTSSGLRTYTSGSSTLTANVVEVGVVTPTSESVIITPTSGPISTAVALESVPTTFKPTGIATYASGSGVSTGTVTDIGVVTPTSGSIYTTLIPEIESQSKLAGLSNFASPAVTQKASLQSSSVRPDNSGTSSAQTVEFPEGTVFAKTHSATVDRPLSPAQFSGSSAIQGPISFDSSQFIVANRGIYVAPGDTITALLNILIFGLI